MTSGGPLRCPGCGGQPRMIPPGHGTADFDPDSHNALPAAAIVRRKRAAFSLVELLSVLVISTLVAAAVVVNWKGNLSSARMTAALETIIELDRQTRRHTLTHGKRCVMQFHAAKHRISVTRWQGKHELTRTLALNPAVQITQWGHGSNQIVFAARGNSPTYFVRLTDGQQTNRWLLFAGGTGQHHIFEHEEDLFQLLRTIRSASINAG